MTEKTHSGMVMMRFASQSGEDTRAAARADVATVVEHFRAHERVVLALAFSLLRSAADAEEVSQEAFVDLLKALRDGREITHVRAWLLKAVRRRAVDHWRKTQTQRRIVAAVEASQGRGERLGEERPADDPDTPVPRLVVPPPPPMPMTPMDVLQTKAVADVVKSILRAVPRETRACLILHAQGLSYREIAETLDIASTSEVWKRLADFRSRVRRYFDGR